MAGVYQARRGAQPAPASFGPRRYNGRFDFPQIFRAIAMSRPALTLKFKCKKCAKPVTLYLQKTSACSHITPYQGFCKCGEMMKSALWGRLRRNLSRGSALLVKATQTKDPS